MSLLLSLRPGGPLVARRYQAVTVAMNHPCASYWGESVRKKYNPETGKWEHESAVLTLNRLLEDPKMRQQTLKHTRYEKPWMRRKRKALNHDMNQKKQTIEQVLKYVQYQQNYRRENPEPEYDLDSDDEKETAKKKGR